jgi:hypothetical protein
MERLLTSDSPQRKSIDTGRKAAEQLNKNAQTAINTAAIVLPLIFTYLSFRGVPIMDVVKAISDTSVANILWKCVLAIYFLLWVLGTRTDAEDQATVYRYAPNKGRLPFSSLGVIAVLVVFGAILLYSRNFEEFTIALAAFFLADWLAWRYLVRRIIRPIATASRELYVQEGDIIGAEKLAIIERRICGTWKWWRNSVGGVIILLLAFIALLKRDGQALPWLDPVVSWEFIQVMVMTIYVLIMESWIWIERLRAKVALQLLDDLGERYLLSAVPK